jgi:uncharacterized protein YdaU (DUF1376 family)
MNKDAFYFPHFTNARRDRKVRRLIKHLGVEGYGIFFMLLEVLREQTDLKFPLSDIDLLADEFGTSEEKVKAVITGYDLFQIDEEEQFFSPRLILYLQPYFERSERARLAAQKRWGDAKAYANALPEHNDSNASKGKESKGEESKPPTLEQVKEYFTSNGYTAESAERAYNLYQASIEGTSKKMWRDSKGNIIRNWKMKMQSVWFKPENKQQRINPGQI